MEELMWLRMFGGLADSGLDLAVVIAFVAFAVLYFLVPVVGYEPERPVAMLTALYMLAASVGIAVLESTVQWVLVLARAKAGGMPGGGGDDWSTHLMFVFAVAKVALFLAAMLALITGLRSLRRDSARQDRNPPYGIGR
jgi:hypothetical protein